MHECKVLALGFEFYVRLAQQMEAKAPSSPVRAEIPLSNSEQQPVANQHKYKFGTQLTHDLSHVAVLVTGRQDPNGYPPMCP